MGNGVLGVGLTTSGFVQVDRANVYNYGWRLAYGDVIGIGITKENKQKFD